MANEIVYIKRIRKLRGQMQLRVLYLIPHTPVRGVVPSPSSEVEPLALAQLNGTETAALDNGTLVAVPDTIDMPQGATRADMDTLARARYADRAAELAASEQFKHAVTGARTDA